MIDIISILLGLTTDILGKCRCIQCLSPSFTAHLKMSSVQQLATPPLSVTQTLRVAEPRPQQAMDVQYSPLHIHDGESGTRKLRRTRWKFYLPMAVFISGVISGLVVLSKAPPFRFQEQVAYLRRWLTLFLFLFLFFCWSHLAFGNCPWRLTYFLNSPN